MLGHVSYSVSVPTRRNAILPPQISPNHNQCKIPRKRRSSSYLSKILSFTTIQTLPNANANPSAPSTSLKLLAKPPTIERNLNMSNPVNGIPAPKRPEEVKEEKKEVKEEHEDVEYYNFNVGDLVAGVVVSRTGNKLKVNIGSENLASMYLNEFLPINKFETERHVCEIPSNTEGSSAGFGHDWFGNGKMGIFMDKEEDPGDGLLGGVTEEGTVVYAEVLGRALTGEALLSCRRNARKLAWQRVRQVKEENEPIEIYISEWNSGGLVARIEGLRAFLPKREMLNTPFDNFAALKGYVGTWMNVVIINVDEALTDLTVSERRAWEMRNFYEGNLLQGTIIRLFPYGAQVNVDGTSLSGLLHISNISCARVSSVSDLLSKGEKVKVLVICSNIPDKPTFSTADLESEKGLILSNKEKVFKEAEQIAAAYRSRLRHIWRMHEREARTNELDALANTNEVYANWDWFSFEPVKGSSLIHC
uniref:TSA: Wollemia nobilis Ref_Wollemi_Transcript_19616_1550 transcribed RNA sequence n=1 Tax=Wollemia nobilis TaxID=56998 RepID=A0A0C9RHW1_9CONI